MVVVSVGLDPRGPLPPGVSMLPIQKQRVPPPPGEDSREASGLSCVYTLTDIVFVTTVFGGVTIHFGLSLDISFSCICCGVVHCLQNLELLLSDREMLAPNVGVFFSFQVWHSEEMSVGGPKIPQVLEKILQLKEIRQEQLTDPAGP